MALTEYFLGDSDAQHDNSNKPKPYEKHINAKNPSGMGGAIARAYGDLLVDLWGGKMSDVAPRNFKVGRTWDSSSYGGGGGGRDTREVTIVQGNVLKVASHIAYHKESRK